MGYTGQSCLGDLASLGLMTSILQGTLDPADFPEGRNAINDNMPEVLGRYFEEEGGDYLHHRSWYYMRA